MNYTNIFASLETDAKRLNIEGDWKKYFYDKPYPDHYKQSWLIKRVMDLEATVTGATFLIKDAEISELKKSLSDAKTKRKDAEDTLFLKTTFYENSLKSKQKDFDYLISILKIKRLEN